MLYLETHLSSNLPRKSRPPILIGIETPLWPQIPHKYHPSVLLEAQLSSNSHASLAYRFPIGRNVSMASSPSTPQNDAPLCSIRKKRTYGQIGPPRAYLFTFFYSRKHTYGQIICPSTTPPHSSMLRTAAIAEYVPWRRSAHPLSSIGKNAFMTNTPQMVTFPKSLLFVETQLWPNTSHIADLPTLFYACVEFSYCHIRHTSTLPPLFF